MSGLDGARPLPVVALRRQRGVVSVEFRRYPPLLSVVYDPGRISPTRVERLASAAGDEVGLALVPCRAQVSRNPACATCALVPPSARGHTGLQRADFIAPELCAEYGGSAPLDLTGELLAQVPLPRAEDARASFANEQAAFRRGLRRMTVLTLTCLSALVAGYATESLAGEGWLAISLYALAYAAGGYYRVLDGVAVLMKDRTLDINFLMIAGAFGAAMLGEWAEGAVLIFLFALSTTLETYAMGRTRAAIGSLLEMAPQEATLVTPGGDRLRVAVEELRPGNTVLVRPAERIPIDGTVIGGTSSVDQSAITGESLPVGKDVGDPVHAGTLNGRGSLEVRVDRPAADSTLARIVAIVQQAQAEKAGTQLFTDWINKYYTWAVIAGALGAMLLPALFSAEPFAVSFYRAMTLLVVASPCALVISIPAAILSAIAAAARRGVLFKGGAHVERLSEIRVVAFDKTGTLTEGEPRVTDAVPWGVSGQELLMVAAAVEANSEHPLAAAIADAARVDGLALRPITHFEAVTGKGVRARLDGIPALVGTSGLLNESGVVPAPELLARVADLQVRGRTVMLVALGGQAIGCIAVADTPRPSARRVVAALKAEGVTRVVMLSGDNPRVAQAVGHELGVDEALAELLPEEKLQAIKSLEQRYGRVAMVGDGVNDAPALAAASVGIAMGGAGTDVALETADVVLMGDDLANLPLAIALSRAARRVMIQNLAFSVLVIAALITATLLGELRLPLAVVGHEGSTILVALNGLRLLAYARKP